ncbi:N-acetylglucosamine kinase [Clostridium vincentii]|uniref:Glucosamine kinase GspK n=1 Tax=Clostridium vincentii TaxID=52704 RepID=A0A2T0BD24_9CLOT|nr:BadF/BadG/BcrA/BcrD ATPase family protein [Clostridium vincentii]PRR81788.1 Glucosamine kinase GspK [Clostridium vincentii]
MYYIGVDGGGTKTSFSLMDREENIIETIERGACHHNQVGLRGMGRIIQEGIESLIKSNSISKNAINCVCLGLAGYGKVEKINREIDKALKEISSGINYVVYSDVHIARAGALNKEDGIVIISGTGSIAYAINNGENRRAGGWGHSIGDEGSAYWIGKKTIEYFSKEADGRFEKGPLYYLMKEELKIDNDYDLIVYVNNEIRNSRREIAKLSKICTEAAKQGDQNAIKIFKEAAFELAALVNTLIKDFHGEQVNVSYIGGVFKAGDLILGPLTDYLDKRAKLRAPKFSPDVGACLIAKFGKEDESCTVLD